MTFNAGHVRERQRLNCSHDPNACTEAGAK